MALPSISSCHGPQRRRPYPKVEQKFRNPNDASETWSGRATQILARPLLNIRRLGFQRLGLRQRAAGTMHFEPGGVSF
jgi:hypothetical protein